MTNSPNSKILTPDQKTVVSKTIKDTKLAIVSLLQLVSKDELDVVYPCLAPL
jgi:hypothetical protein